eukprot:242792_1
MSLRNFNKITMMLLGFLMAIWLIHITKFASIEVKSSVIASVNTTIAKISTTPPCPLNNESNVYYEYLRRSLYAVKKTRRKKKPMGNDFSRHEMKQYNFLQKRDKAGLGILGNKHPKKRKPKRSGNRTEMRIKKDSCWINTNKNKLIIFLHFHKSGGSSICNYAQTVAQLPKLNANCNPKTILDGQSHNIYNNRIPFWDFDLRELTSYFQNLKFEHVSFIAMEDYYFINSDYLNRINSVFLKNSIKYKIELVTQFRDPFSRFVSNFFYSIKRRLYREIKEMRVDDIKKRLLWWHNRKLHPALRRYKHITSDWNMHIRILTSIYGNKIVNESDLEIAKKELRMFDTIIILEIPETYILLEIKYGIKNVLHAKQCCGKHESVHTLSEYNMDVLKQFEEEYKILNKYDYMLYEYAVELSLEG